MKAQLGRGGVWEGVPRYIDDFGRWRELVIDLVFGHVEVEGQVQDLDRDFGDGQVQDRDFAQGCLQVVQGGSPNEKAAF